ncbi:hypothetical protein QLQ12_44405 [Actinoplanes sp. NEAU-A12]|uniref:Uncharacterized protein n=1 Tax=Actinoplanes sandaracinus TaxID=3045177 RepID=A0ABT6X0V8_9ACTN|nr:hypothetical protein [Actinoplanes sandaracinus]MDI6105646.1 hypothetical protein [Actinoplanes sandaracinus]
MMAHVVLALACEHQALDQPDPPIATGDYPVLLLSAVDKAVAFASNVRRAEQAGPQGRSRLGTRGQADVGL